MDRDDIDGFVREYCDICLKYGLQITVPYGFEYFIGTLHESEAELRDLVQSLGDELK